MLGSITERLNKQKYTWLVTGAAGFIGLNIVEQLLLLNQKVVALDNFYSSSKQRLLHLINNLTKINGTINLQQDFVLYEQSITDYDKCNNIFKSHSIDFVIHHAAIASVPLSIEQPRLISHVNIDGFNNIIDLAKDYSAKALVYASSSAVYGDCQDSLKNEHKIGRMLSPYAISKYTNEQFAAQYSKHYNLNTIGLRYFNIYGKYQNPNSAYAAVIPRWITKIINNKTIVINGDGSTTRDFCYIDNVVQANILACLQCLDNNTIKKIYNIGTGEAISLNQLLQYLLGIADKFRIPYNKELNYSNFLEGDIKHSCANINLATQQLHYTTQSNFEDSLYNTFEWFLHNEQ